MKFGVLLSAAALSIVAGILGPAHAAKEEDFLCRPNVFGCWIEYVGPRNTAATMDYVEDARAAIDWLMENEPAVVTAHLHFGTGRLVIEIDRSKMKNGAFFRNDVLEYFQKKRRLYVSSVTLMEKGLNRMIMSYHTHSGSGGRSRYFRIRHNPVVLNPAPTTKVHEKLKKAFAPMMKDTFGNIIIISN